MKAILENRHARHRKVTIAIHVALSTTRHLIQNSKSRLCNIILPLVFASPKLLQEIFGVSLLIHIGIILTDLFCHYRRRLRGSRAVSTETALRPCGDMMDAASWTRMTLNTPMQILAIIFTAIILAASFIDAITYGRRHFILIDY